MYSFEIYGPSSYRRYLRRRIGSQRIIPMHIDVIFFMDSDCDDKELKKLASYVIWAGAARHGEYDFGSYKRAYEYAARKKLLDKYDFVYLINDSVYGPLRPLMPVLSGLESRGLDAFGMVKNPNRRAPHIGSWFIGMRPNVFRAQWFDKFMRGIKKQPDKGSVAILYEHGFTARVIKANLTWGCVTTIFNRGVYNRVKQMFRAGVPFIKKLSFTRHNGALGAQISYVLRHADAPARNAVMASARRTLGTEYMKWLLSRNSLRMAARSVVYMWNKFIMGRK